MSLNNKDIELVDILFFPSLDNRKKFMDFLNTATTSILLHIFSTSVSIFGVFMENDEIAKTLLGLVNKGVKIQIITDNICFGNSDGRIHNLSTFCDVIYLDNDFSINERYAIIDDTYFLSGSFDWVHQSFDKKYQDIHILKSEQFVSLYKSYFFNIWNINQRFLVPKIQ
jgi:hypothetical protein